MKSHAEIYIYILLTVHLTQYDKRESNHGQNIGPERQVPNSLQCELRGDGQSMLQLNPELADLL